MVKGVGRAFKPKASHTVLFFFGFVPALLE
jgi:hypothetical protein